MNGRWAGYGTALLVLAAGLAAAAAGTPTAAAIVVPAVVGALASVALVHGYTRGTAGDVRRLLLALTLVAFVLRFGLSLVISSSTALQGALAPDSLGYHQTAIDIVAAWRDGTGPVVATGPGKEGFVLGLAALYRLFGPHESCGLALVAAFSAGLIPVSHDTTRRLFGPAAARTVAVMVSVLPGYVLWSSQLLREAPIIFFLAVLANAVVRLSDRISAPVLAVAVGCLLVLFTLRSNVALIALCGAAAGLVAGSRRAGRGVLVGCVTLAAVAGAAVVFGLGAHGVTASPSANLQQLAFYRRALGTDTGSAINADVDVGSPGAAIAFLPTAVVSFLLGPFPWQVKNLFQALGVVDAASLWIIAPALVRGLRLGLRQVGRRLLPLLLPAALLLVMLSLLISNYGMIVRERPQVIILLLPIAARGWIGRRSAAAQPARTLSRPAGRPALSPTVPGPAPPPDRC